MRSRIHGSVEASHASARSNQRTSAFSSGLLRSGSRVDHEGFGRAGVDRPDRARHVRGRRTVERMRIGLQSLKDGRSVRGLLLVEGPVRAYVVDERHEDIVRRAGRGRQTIPRCFLLHFTLLNDNQEGGLP